jgi:hypothetical protein
MLQTIAVKILSDANFATALIASPEKTLREAGFNPTPAMIDALSNVTTADLQLMVDSLKNGKVAF